MSRRRRIGDDGLPRQRWDRLKRRRADENHHSTGRLLDAMRLRRRQVEHDARNERGNTVDCSAHADDAAVRGAGETGSARSHAGKVEEDAGRSVDRADRRGRQGTVRLDRDHRFAADNRRRNSLHDRRPRLRTGRDHGAETDCDRQNECCARRTGTRGAAEHGRLHFRIARLPPTAARVQNLIHVWGFGTTRCVFSHPSVCLYSTRPLRNREFLERIRKVSRAIASADGLRQRAAEDASCRHASARSCSPSCR